MIGEEGTVCSRDLAHILLKLFPSDLTHYILKLTWHSFCCCVGAQTGAATVMVAERAAEMLLQEYAERNLEEPMAMAA